GGIGNEQSMRVVGVLNGEGYLVPSTDDMLEVRAVRQEAKEGRLRDELLEVVHHSENASLEVVHFVQLVYNEHGRQSRRTQTIQQDGEHPVQRRGRQIEDEAVFTGRFVRSAARRAVLEYGRGCERRRYSCCRSAGSPHPSREEPCSHKSTGQ